MQVKSQRDFWSGLMFLVVGVAFAWGSLAYPFGSSASPGPAYFPFGLGVLQALLGGVLLFKALTLESAGGDPVGAIAWRPLLVVVASVAAFGFLLPRAGLVLALPLLIAGASLAGGEFRWKESLLSSAALTAGSWLIFVWGLKLPLPVWPAFLQS